MPASRSAGSRRKAVPENVVAVDTMTAALPVRTAAEVYAAHAAVYSFEHGTHPLIARARTRADASGLRPILLALCTSAPSKRASMRDVLASPAIGAVGEPSLAPASRVWVEYVTES